MEDTPLRVEVMDEEAVAEKVAMPPGDIAMMLSETGGLRVQATNPSLGGANLGLMSRRPGDESERTLLANQTSRGGTDAVFLWERTTQRTRWRNTARRWTPAAPERPRCRRLE